jgi:hypothetical protein
MTIVLMTANRRKIAEYRRFLARHAQDLLVEQPTESEASLAAWLETARAVLADESNIFDLDGDLVEPTYDGPARNICRLHAWVRGSDGKIVRKSYVREVRGHFHGQKLRPNDPTVFNWDAAFRLSVTDATLEAMDAKGLKNSAREQCLSAFAKQMLHRKERKTLRWSVTDPADWSADARLLIDHPLYQNLATPLRNALAFVIDQGVFFRAAKSRRDGNYWFPGLNGGLPYVPKGDALHEGTYMFHDVMHQLMPDLVFDGAATHDHKRVYIAYRMMSEGISLVLADMLFVHGLASDPVHTGYDFTKRRIRPLYEAIEPAKREDLEWLLRQVCTFLLRGEAGELPAHTEAWSAFSTKYSRFFVADFQWTRMNWLNLVARSESIRAWIDLVHPETFGAQGVWFISQVVDEIGRGLPLDVLCDRLFELVLQRRVMPALAFAGVPDVERSRSAGVRRWLTGQLALFARYAPVVGMPAIAHELAARVRDPRLLTADEITAIRARLREHVEQLAKDGVISNDDAAIFPDLFPLFDPFFLRDYDEAQQEFETVAEASRAAFAP